MIPSRSSSTTSWVTATSLAVGATVAGTAAVGVSSAPAALAAVSCPAGSALVAANVCQVVFASTATWHAPAGVTSLQILAVGAGGGGGGGTTYAAGGGGGGGQVSVCTTTLVDLTTPLQVKVGSGGAGGANGSANPIDSSLGDKYGLAGANGGSSWVSSTRNLCVGVGGRGGQPGYNYYTTSLGTSPTYGGGGNSGSGLLGGSPANLVADNTHGCTFSTIQYNLTASGGAGNAQAGNTPSQGVSGGGGNGSSPTSGLFANTTTTYGGGGGGGSGKDCSVTATPGAGGLGGGGNGGKDIIPAPVALPTSTGAHSTHALGSHGSLTIVFPSNGLAHSGGGGGGGAGVFPGIGPAGGTAGASGGSGVVVIRFAPASAAPITTAVHFAVASYALTSADKASLSTFVNSAISKGELAIDVAAFTDPSGSVAYNAWLSQARANATASYIHGLFVAHKVNAKVTALGKGISTQYATYAQDRVAIARAHVATS